MLVKLYMSGKINLINNIKYLLLSNSPIASTNQEKTGFKSRRSASGRSQAAKDMPFLLLLSDYSNKIQLRYKVQAQKGKGKT